MQWFPAAFRRQRLLYFIVITTEKEMILLRQHQHRNQNLCSKFFFICRGNPTIKYMLCLQFFLQFFEQVHFKQLLSPSLRPSVGRSISRSVGLYAIISKDRKFHFHTPFRALVLRKLLPTELCFYIKLMDIPKCSWFKSCIINFEFLQYPLFISGQLGQSLIVLLP